MVLSVGQYYSEKLLQCNLMRIIGPEIYHEDHWLYINGDENCSYLYIQYINQWSSVHISKPIILINLQNRWSSL